MLASPSVAIDLRLKAVAWQDASGRVWLSYNSSEYFKHRYGLPETRCLLCLRLSGSDSQHHPLRAGRRGCDRRLRGGDGERDRVFRMSASGG
jgi:hypothetical protein